MELGVNDDMKWVLVVATASTLISYCCKTQNGLTLRCQLTQDVLRQW